MSNKVQGFKNMQLTEIKRFVSIASWLLIFQLIGVTLANIDLGPSSGEPKIQKKISAIIEEAISVPLNCYVCSTTEYEDPTKNYCRYMNSIPRYPNTFSANMLGYHSSISNQKLYQDRVQQQQQPSNSEHSTNNNWPLTNHEVMNGNHSANNKSLSTSSSFNGQQESNMTTSANNKAHESIRAHSPIKQTSDSAIKSRLCVDEEKFCSIVSISRLEFANNTVLHRFWALERNCSKSCNHGCMVIGERVRLKVCSQCCSGNYCNTENGSISKFFGLIPLMKISDIWSILGQQLLELKQQSIILLLATLLVNIYFSSPNWMQSQFG